MTVRIFNIEVNDFKSAGSVTALADGAIEAVTTAFRELLGDAPTFEQYESARVAWRLGYAEQRGDCSAGALNVAWKRFRDALGADIKKPKANTAEAKRKAAQRATASGEAADPVNTREEAEALLIKASELIADPVKREAAKIKFSEAAKLREKAERALAKSTKKPRKPPKRSPKTGAKRSLTVSKPSRTLPPLP